jgi:hypothetical protein
VITDFTLKVLTLRAWARTKENGDVILSHNNGSVMERLLGTSVSVTHPLWWKTVTRDIGTVKKIVDSLCPQ